MHGDLNAAGVSLSRVNVESFPMVRTKTGPKADTVASKGYHTFGQGIQPSET